MTALFICSLIVAAFLFVLGCMDQRKLYWKTSAWKYRDPEANEPSDSALAMNRFGLFAVAVAFLVIAGIVHAADEARDYSTARVKAVAYAVASRLDEGPRAGLGSSLDTRSDVFDAVRDEGDGNVRIRSTNGGFELTNREGRNPVCLTVAVDTSPGPIGGPRSHSVSTTVDEGRC
jgi:hypothetical protein